MARAYAILCFRQNEINDLQKSTKQNPYEFVPYGGFIIYLLNKGILEIAVCICYTGSS